MKQMVSYSPAQGGVQVLTPWGNARPVTLPDLILILRRRLGLAVFPILFGLVPALWLIAGLADQYTAHSAVLVHPPAGQFPDAQLLRTETDVITSERLTRTVIAAAGLLELDEFNPPEKPSILPPRLLRLLPTAPDRPQAAADPVATEVLPRFRKRLAVSSSPDSRVVAIQFTAQDPAVAARVANLLAERYIAQQLETMLEIRQTASTWLNGRVEGLRTTVENLERAAEDFRARSDIIEGRNSRLVSEQISGTGERLLQARAEADTAAAHAQELKATMARHGSRSLLEASTSPATARLLELDLQARSRQQTLLARYGASHPTVLANRVELQSLEQRVRTEADNRIAAAQAEAAVADQRVRTLETTLTGHQEELARVKQAEVELRAREREAATRRALLEKLLSQLNDQEQLTANQPVASVLSRAMPPALPSGPKKLALAAGAAVVAGILWLLLVITAELMDKGIKSTEEIRHELNAVPLGLVPRIPSLLRAPLSSHVLTRPKSAYAEALRMVLNATQLEQRRHGGGRRIMITSAVAEEGKTMLVASLGRLAATQGLRVLMIDGDLRRPGLDRMLGKRALGKPRQPLPPHLPFAELIQEDIASGAHVITAGRIGQALGTLPPLPFLVALLARIPRHDYDLILVDMPPVVPVSDARVLAQEVDHCMFVVRWRKTAPRVARYALDQLRDDGVSIAGIVVTQVEPRKHALYGYADSAVSARSAYHYYSG